MKASRAEAKRDKSKPAEGERWFDVFRECVESIAIAFILAFLIRTFEAEAFSIPTGSMAPTLMGRHKDVECPVCGYQYQFGASYEMNGEVEVDSPLNSIRSGVCPMCRYKFDLLAADLDLASGETPPPMKPEDLNNALRRGENPSYGGDKILVDKLTYKLRDPWRWDIAVFKYPGNSQTNYIKRLVGLPGETITIDHGNLYVQGEDETEVTIARKPPLKLLAMLQLVFDNDRMGRISEAGIQPRWSGDDAWSSEQNHTVFSCAPTDGQMHVLRYTHTAPTRQEWAALEQGASTHQPISPKLLGDFYGYNTYNTFNTFESDGPFGFPSHMPERIKLRAYDERTGDAYGLEEGANNWVGELALGATIKTKATSGEILLELVEGGYRMQCRIDLADGKARMAIVPPSPDAPAATTEDGKPFAPTVDTHVKGPGTYNLMFANVDDQLTLFIGGSPVKFDSSTKYAPLENNRPTLADLQPASVGVTSADVTVSRLKLFRDVYYVAQRYELDGSPVYEPPGGIQFEIGQGEFLALGDNSPSSKDSRLWMGQQAINGGDVMIPIRPTLRRELLVGRAVFIYWPHSWNRIPGTGIPFPFFPNFAEMGFIR